MPFLSPGYAVLLSPVNCYPEMDKVRSLTFDCPFDPELVDATKATATRANTENAMATLDKRVWLVGDMQHSW